MRKFITALTLTVLVLGSAGLAEAGWDEGVAAFKAGNFSTAAKEFQAVVEASPEYASGHFMLGQALAQLNRDNDALGAFRKAYDLDPNSLQFQFALANAYLAVERYDEAASLYERINPSQLQGAHQAAYHKNKMIALDKSGRADEAFAALRDVARSNPRDASAQYAYGVAAFNAGETATAVTTLAKAVELDGNAKHREAYTKALIRQAREDRGQKASAYAKAAQQAKALADATGSYDHLVMLGETHLGAKQYQSAAAAFQKAVDKKPNDWLALFYLSQAQTSLQNYAAAEDSLRKALAARPSSDNEKRIYRQIGFVNEKLRKYEEAKVAYTRAGDQASVARVEKNQQIAAENRQIEAENERIEAVRAEQERLQQELEELSEPPF